MKTQALVIVDMQPGFDPAKDEKTIAQVLVAIEEAKQSDIPIIILELDNNSFGKTLDCIVEAVDLYDKVYFVDKSQNSGGNEVEHTVSTNGLEISEYVVCGVNISFCVAATVRTLVEEYDRDIVVLQSACNCDTLSIGRYKNREEVFTVRSIFSDSHVTLAGYPD